MLYRQGRRSTRWYAEYGRVSIFLGAVEVSRNVVIWGKDEGVSEVWRESFEGIEQPLCPSGQNRSQLCNSGLNMRTIIPHYRIS